MNRSIKTILAALGLTAGMLSTYASTNYWDNNGDTAGFGTAGGVWGTESKWSADSAGGAVPGVTGTTDSDDLHFGTAASGLESGTITVDGASQAFRSMTFGAASGAVTLSGGALTLAAPASKVIVNNFSNTIASVLAGTNGLHKYKPASLTYASFLTESSGTLFSNAALSDYSGAGGIMHGAYIARVPANAYYFANDGTTATYQLQALDGGYTKCVKVELTQSGADIAARAVYAKYVDGSQLGFDFDAGGNEGTVATSPDTAGYGVAQTTLYSNPKVYEPFLTSSPLVIFANAALADYVDITATLAGGSISGGSTPATPCHFSTDGTTLTVQMQAVNDLYTKCVKIELTQSGADIAARAVYAKYVDGSQLGFDFDVGGNEGGIAASYGDGGYGIAQTSLAAVNILTLAGVNTYSGDTTIGGGTLEIGGAGLLGSGSYAGAIMNSGTLLYNSSSNQNLGGAISGTGSLVKESPSKRNSSFVTYGSFLTTTPAVIFENYDLADCVGADGVLGGTSFDNGWGLSADAYHFSNNGTTATYQLQGLESPFTKCVKVELTQSGANIAGRVVYARYIVGSQLGYDFDTGANENDIATGHTSPGYGAAETTLNLNLHSKLTLSGSNSYIGGTVVNCGFLEAVASASALPSSGGIVVNNTGELVLNVGGMFFFNSGGVGNGNPITVHSGGTLTLASAFNAGYSRSITVNGGTLNFRISENNDGANYVNNLTLQNGARVTGYKMRVGNEASASIVVSGTSASSLAAGLNMVYSGNETMTFNVADVTGSPDADLSIPGVIRDYTDRAGLPIIKTGAGTLSLSGANTHTGPITITAGTVALGAEGALNAGNPITLSGGTLDMGAYANGVGTLAVASNSVVALGSGKLAFADSSGMSWTGTLTLAGQLGAQTVRVGTNESALTSGQLAAITLNGGRVEITGDGYLVPPPKGTLLWLQ